jgi:hypothetical protein
MPHSQITLVNTEDSSGPPGPPPTPKTYRILQEDDALILAENGNPLRKEQNT